MRLPGFFHPVTAVARGVQPPLSLQAPVSRAPRDNPPVPSFHPPGPRAGPRSPSSPWPRRPRGGSRQGAALCSSHGRRWPGGASPPMHRRAPAGRTATTGTGKLPAPSPWASPGRRDGEPRGAGQRRGRTGGSGGRREPRGSGAGVGAGATPGASRARRALPPEALTGARSQSEAGQNPRACAAQRDALPAAILEKGAAPRGALREGHARSGSWPRPRSSAHAPEALSRAAGNGR